MLPARRLAAAAVGALTGILVGVLVGAAPALAHNELRSATPCEGDRLNAPPTQVVLEFVERLDPRYTSIAVTAPGGSPAAAGKPQVTGERAVQPLAPSSNDGEYTVIYRVVSLDGHPVQGAFTFTVGTPATPARAAAALPGAPSPGAPSPGAPSPGACASAGGPSPGVIASGGGGSAPAWAVAAAGLLLAGVAGALMWQRRGRLAR